MAIKKKAKPAKKAAQPMVDGMTMRQAVAVRLQGKFAGEVSWKFGHASFETEAGKVFCFITRDGSLALKLPEERINELVEAGQAKTLRMGTRSMREWAVVAEPESAFTLRLLRDAQRYVESLPVVVKKAVVKKKAKGRR